MPGPQLSDPALDGRFATPDRVGKGPKHGLELWREPVEIHRSKRTAAMLAPAN
jgi:hypothetical protein